MADLNRFWQARPDLQVMWTKMNNLVNGVPPEDPSETEFLQSLYNSFGGDLNRFVQTIYDSNPASGDASIGEWEAAQGIPLSQMTGTPPAGYGQAGTTTPPPTTPPTNPGTGTTPPPTNTGTGTTPPPTNAGTGTTPPPTNTGTGAANWWGSAAQPTYGQLLQRWDATGMGQTIQGLSPEAAQQAFNTWAGTQSPGGNWDPSGSAPTGVGTVGTSGEGTIIKDANGNPVRDLAAEGVATQEAALRLAPGWAAAYQKYAPQYAQTDLNVMGQSLFGPNFSGNLSDINRRLTTEAIEQTNTGNRAARQAGVADMAEFGGLINQTRMDLNPALWQNLDTLDAQARAGVVTPSPYQTAMGNIFNAGINTAPVSAQTVQTPGNVSAQNVNVMANPWLTNAANAQRGQSALGGELSAAARQQLALGSGLSEEQKRNASQAAREAWGARNLINSTGSVAAEILNRDAYGQQLLGQRQAFAQNVEQLGQSQQGINDAYTANILGQLGTRTGQDLSAQQANQSAGLNAAQFNAQTGMEAQRLNQAAALNAAQFNAGLTQSDRQQMLGLGQSLAGLQNTQQQQNFNNLMSQTQLRAQNQNDPFAILSIGTANQGTNSALGGMGGTASSGGYGNQSVYQQFNPFSSYGSDVFNTNYNAGESRYLNAQNNAANLQAAGKAAEATKKAGLFQGIGNIVSSIFNCWVAREVFGEHDPRWLLFRYWMLNVGPAWFRKLYLKHGEAFARWLKRNQWAKPPIRWFMESRIASLKQIPYLEVA